MAGHAQFDTWSPRAGIAPTHESGRALDAIWVWGCGEDLVSMHRNADCDQLCPLSGVSDHYPVGVSWGIGVIGGAPSSLPQMLEIDVLELVDV